MTKPSCLIVALGTLISALVLAQMDSTEKGISDRELGLSKTSVFETPSPDPVVENANAPGEGRLLGRPHPAAPPAVPHGIDDWLPITLDSNSCIDCHQVEVKEEGEPTPIPASHYTDLRREPGQIQETVTGARYNCIACHVALTQTEDLVENRFADPQDR